jgi:hypothetical protein
MPKSRYITRDGLVMRVGGPLYRWWRRYIWPLTHAKPVPGPKPKPPTPAPPAPPKPKPFTPLEGVDGVSVPGGAQLRAAHKHFAGRYLSTPGNPKNLTKAEAVDLHAHGIGIVLFFETDGKGFEGGRAQGVRDAASAVKQLTALNPRLGLRASPVAVYFTVDVDPRGHEVKIVDYVKGAASLLGRDRTGVYGGLAAVDACSKANACRYFCQAYAWSGGVWHPARHLEQYANGVRLAGHEVDLERAVRAQYGAWLP